jgi:exodeoxyribonuclease VII small subunit
MASKKNPVTEERPDFESALGELESLVARLEQGDLPLEQALADFERGVTLTRHCQGALATAQQRVEMLVQQDGGAVLQAMDPGSTDDDDR